MVDYTLLIKSLILPLVIYEDQVVVTEEKDEEGVLNIEVKVSNKDFGRVIGKGGKIANAMRTIVYAAATKEEKRVKVNIGQLDE